jgi:serine/threonine protein kinase
VVGATLPPRVKTARMPGEGWLFAVDWRDLYYRGLVTGSGSEAPLRPGAQVGPYEVLGHLATGGMGEVYLAKRRGIGGFERTVVLKIMLQHLTHDERFSAMFIDEARISSQLSHPNIVQVFDLGRAEGGALYLAMEHLHGQSTATCLKQSAQSRTYLPETTVARIVCDAVSGLAYAHGAVGPDGQPLGFVHRDVSPENLFVTYAGPTKVLDFGVAKVRDRISKTQAGEFKGKVGYMAPEIIRGEPVDARADLFSVGVVLFEMLTTRRLFHAAVPATALHRVLQAPIPEVRRVRPEVDPELDRLVQELLVRDPAARIQSAEEVADRLERWLAPREGTQKHVGQWMRSNFADALMVSNRIVQAAEGTGSVNPADLAEARRLGGEGLADTLVLELSTEEREGQEAAAMARVVASEADSDTGWIERSSIGRGALGVFLSVAVAAGLAFLGWRYLEAQRAAFAAGTTVAPRLVIEAPLAEGDGSSYFQVKQAEGEGPAPVLWASASLPEGQGPIRDAIAAQRDKIVGLELPEIPAPLEVGVFAGRVYGTYRLAEGRPLSEVLAKEVIPPERGRHLLTELGEILAEAHEVGLLHGALDPGVIWIERGDGVRLLAFQGGMAAPTPPSRYRAPEQKPLEPGSPTADQYALGVLAAELLKLSDQEAAVRVAPIVARAQAVEPIDRYRSYREFWEQLSDVLGKRPLKKRRKG